MMEWTRKERGWYIAIPPEGTWIARKSYGGGWRLFYQPIGGRLERHGKFSRLRAAKKYAERHGITCM